MSTALPCFFFALVFQHNAGIFFALLHHSLIKCENLHTHNTTNYKPLCCVLLSWPAKFVQLISKSLCFWGQVYANLYIKLSACMSRMLGRGGSGGNVLELVLSNCIVFLTFCLRIQESVTFQRSSTFNLSLLVNLDKDYFTETYN